MITEIGLMGGKPNTNIMDNSTPEGKIMTSTYTNIFNHPTGPKNVYWGVQIEDPLKVWALFDWNSLEDHENFARTYGGEAVKDLPKILTHGVFTKHIKLEPSPALALQAPVTGFLMSYFSSDIDDAGKEVAMGKVKKALGEFPDLKDVKFGWGIENDFPILGEGEEVRKGCVLIVFIGWQTEEECEEFKGRAGGLKGMEGVIGMAEGSVRLRCLMGSEEKEK